MLRTLTVAVLLAAIPGAGIAQTQTTPVTTTESQQAESGKPPQRIRSITLTGNEKCPQSSNPDDEIVVCARIGEPYRIPKALRDDKPIPAQNQSWVNRAALADEVGRRAAGLPDTCSPTGSGGQTGCARLRAEQYAAERAEARRVQAAIP
ncbi:hypothetical protein [Sphingomonas psychrolutea]|uniref:Secreted protein n=1 Tax=Sphingomonas psychrolutea TaxID=1259676 RepID=A0ABQ1H5L8_9SPHN|nr:hypothetical protein [Sphingomonas psychrolutea]GGA59635.1 hypothetical protein GCM10011395_32440 [Sphingomonas psychrolutea]